MGRRPFESGRIYSGGTRRGGRYRDDGLDDSFAGHGAGVGRPCGRRTGREGTTKVPHREGKGRVGGNTTPRQLTGDKETVPRRTYWVNEGPTVEVQVLGLGVKVGTDLERVVGGPFRTVVQGPSKRKSGSRNPHVGCKREGCKSKTFSLTPNQVSGRGWR